MPYQFPISEDSHFKVHQQESSIHFVLLN